MAETLRLAQRIYEAPQKLTPDDFMSHDDYECHRREVLGLATSHCRLRRLRLGDDLSLLFETRFTGWLQIQEELRWLARPTQVDIEELLTRCNSLVAKRGKLIATLFIDSSDRAASRQWAQSIANKNFSIALRLAGTVMRGQPQHPSTETLSTVHTFIFRPKASCGPVSELVWGDSVHLRVAAGQSSGTSAFNNLHRQASCSQQMA